MANPILPVLNTVCSTMVRTPSHLLTRVSPPQLFMVGAQPFRGRLSYHPQLREMAEAMAAYIATGDADNLPLPLTPIAPLPLHALHRLYVSAIIAWYRLSDGGIR